MSRQLTLDLGTPPPSTFDNFFPGANGELLTRLRGLDAALAAGPVADRTFYVWGEAGNGRSHLLHALAHEAPPGHARYLGPPSALAAFTFDPRVAIYAVDDCDQLSGAQQIALFNLFNEVRAHPTCALVATGDAAPLGLAVREDLRTRLGWGLVFHLAPLSDEGKAAVLKHAARERGIALADDVPAYLLTHFRRDMPSLMTLLDALDRFSLEQKRAVTLPLLRTMLAAGADTLAQAVQLGEDDENATLGLFDEATGEDLGTDAAGTSASPVEPESAESAAPDHPPASAAFAQQSLPTPAQPTHFEGHTDNVDGELGAGFAAEIDRELGGELVAELGAEPGQDLRVELNGQLDGDLEAAPGAGQGESAPAADDAGQAGTEGPKTPPTDPRPDAPGDAHSDAGNGFTRFK